MWSEKTLTFEYFANSARTIGTEVFVKSKLDIFFWPVFFNATITAKAVKENRVDCLNAGMDE